MKNKLSYYTNIIDWSLHELADGENVSHTKVKRKEEDND